MDKSEDLGEEILVALRKIIRAIDLNSRALAQKHGITGPQVVVLKELQKNGETPVGGLAKSVSLSHATVTGILDRLERQKLVEKSRDTVDKRRIFVRATEKGLQLAETAPPVLQQEFLEELKQLKDWEQNLILSSLQRISAMMEARELSVEPVLVTGPILATPEETKEFLEPMDVVEHRQSGDKETKES
ncbi:MAG: MarR family winged helix-turn-helix transcriptional regulator [Bacteroidota bacterium]